MLLPHIYSWIDKVPIVSRDVLTRRVRLTDPKRLFDAFISTSASRVLRLLYHPIELEAEAYCSRPSARQLSEVIISDEEYLSKDNLQDSLEKAQHAHVRSGPFTEEFMRARYAGEETMQTWKEYKRNCRMRSRWGEYLRSNLEWDWDLSFVMKRLFYNPVRKNSMVHEGRVQGPLLNSNTRLLQDAMKQKTTAYHSNKENVKRKYH